MTHASLTKAINVESFTASRLRFHVLCFLALIVLLVPVLSGVLLTNSLKAEPQLGFSLLFYSDGAPNQIEKVTSGSAAEKAGLKSGQRVKAIRLENGRAISAEEFVPLVMDISVYAEGRAEKNTEVWHALRQNLKVGHSIWVTTDAGTVEVPIEQVRTYNDLSLLYWFVLLDTWLIALIASICILTARDNWVAASFALIGLMLSLAGQAHLASREAEVALLLIDPVWVMRANCAFSVGAIAAASLIALNHPTRILWPWLRVAILLLIAAILFAFLVPWGIFTSFFNGTLLAITLTTLVVLTVVQIGASSGSLVAKESAGWFGLVIATAASIVAVAFISVPIVNIEFQKVFSFLPYLVIPTFIIGLAVSVNSASFAEYDGAVKVYLTNVTLLLAISFLDLFAIYQLSLKRETSFLLILSSLVLFYLPLRYALWRYIRPDDSNDDLVSALPRVSALTQESAGTLNYTEELAEILADVFSAAGVMPAVEQVGPSRDVSRFYLRVEPVREGEDSYFVSGKANGQKLFNARDKDVRDILLGLLRHNVGIAAREDRVKSVERSRISRDLHDLVGNRLLKLQVTARDEATREAAALAMQGLRESLEDMSLPNIIPLQEAMMFWQDKLDEALCVQPTLADEEPPRRLEIRLASELTAEVEFDRLAVNAFSRILQEYASNLMKYGSRCSAEIVGSVRPDRVGFRFENAVRHSDGEMMGEGRGLRNIRSRIDDIDGSVEHWIENGKFFMSVNFSPIHPQV